MLHLPLDCVSLDGGAGVSCGTKRASSPIRADFLQLTQQSCSVGIRQPPWSVPALLPVPLAKAAAVDGKEVSLNLKQLLSKDMVTPAGCHDQTAPSGQLVLDGIPV